MACGTHSHEDGAAIAVVEHISDVVESAPAGDHVVFVAVVFDVRDAPCVVGGGMAVGRKREAWVVEVSGCGAEGVDFLEYKL